MEWKIQDKLTQMAAQTALITQTILFILQKKCNDWCLYQTDVIFIYLQLLRPKTASS